MSIAQPSRKEHNFPTFDAGPDGFPRPGQVIRHFRQITFKADGKPWTQRDLAQVLGKQELAVRDLELRDIGLNDIIRRRYFAELFAIPPDLLGLAMVPEQRDMNVTPSTWFVQLHNFPTFDAGPDGFPRPGQVIRHFRQITFKADGKPWTQRDLAQVLGKQELAVREMELRDTGLSDISRRRFLAQLFNFPLFLLGLATPPQQFRVGRQAAVAPPKILSVSRHIDLEEVRGKLTGFWTKNDGGSQEVLITLDSILKRLYERYPTTRSNERVEVVTALCEMHIHAANLLRDLGRWKYALEHLNKTKDLNALLNEDELIADVLYRRGGLYLEKGAYGQALVDYHAVEKILANISPPLQAAVLLETALSEARVASSREQYTASLRKLDQAGRIIRREHTEAGREKRPYLRVDLERYHLDRSATLIVAGNPEEALQELELLSFSQLKGRRSIYHLILQAKAYFGLKEYAQAALLAEEALPLVRSMHSQVNLERIKTLHKHFQQTPFRNNPEVARLAYQLFSL